MIETLKNKIRNFIPGSFMQSSKKKTDSIPFDDLRQTMDNQESLNYRELLKKISLKRSYSDEMYDNNGAHYLQVGLSAIQQIEMAINESKINNIKQILDMPCGHGRFYALLLNFSLKLN